jgi:hypothetical protein
MSADLVERRRKRSTCSRTSSRGSRRAHSSDGREFEIVKRFWAPTEIERELAALGRQLGAGTTPNGHFVFASGRRRVQELESH